MIINIQFHDWHITVPDVCIRQFDDRAHTVRVTGDLPAGYVWALHLGVRGGYFDALALTESGGALTGTLGRDQLCFGGEDYALQLVGVCGDVTQHSNVVRLRVGPSLSGDAVWPTLPTAFSECERAVLTAARYAAESAAQAENAAQNVALSLTCADIGAATTDELRAALNLIDEDVLDLANHMDDTEVHLNQIDRDALESAYRHANDLSIHLSQQDREAVTEAYDFAQDHDRDQTRHITAAERERWDDFVDRFQDHDYDSDSHITAAEREKWNSAAQRLDALTVLDGEAF